MHHPARPRIWRPRLSTLFIALVAAALLYVNVTPVVRLKYERVYGFPAHTYYSHAVEAGDSGASLMVVSAGLKFEGILANLLFAFAALQLAARACDLLRRSRAPADSRPRGWSGPSGRVPHAQEASPCPPAVPRS